MSFFEKFKGKIRCINKEEKVKTEGILTRPIKSSGIGKLEKRNRKYKNSLNHYKTNIEEKEPKLVTNGFSAEKKVKPGLAKRRGNYSPYMRPSSKMTQNRLGMPVQGMTLNARNNIFTKQYVYASPIAPPVLDQSQLCQPNPYSHPYVSSQIQQINARTSFVNNNNQTYMKHLKKDPYFQPKMPLMFSKSFCEPSKSSPESIPSIFKANRKTENVAGEAVSTQNIFSNPPYFNEMPCAPHPEHTKIKKRNSSVPTKTKLRSDFFQPFTLKEIIPKNFSFLEGLRSNIGPDDWAKHKSREDRRIELSRNAQQINNILFTQSLKLQPFKNPSIPPVQSSARRMKNRISEYSKKVRNVRRNFLP